MRPIILTAALFAGLSLSACVGMSRSQPVTAMSPEIAAGSRINEITLQTGDDVELTADFPAIFADRVQSRLDACATGDRPLRLEARIDRLDKANPVQTAVIGGANVLRGSARLVDPSTGQLVGEYEIGQTVIGGRIAVVEMAEAEEQMSDAFGEELCEQAF